MNTKSFLKYFLKYVFLFFMLTIELSNCTLTQYNNYNSNRRSWLTNNNRRRPSYSTRPRYTNNHSRPRPRNNNRPTPPTTPTPPTPPRNTTTTPTPTNSIRTNVSTLKGLSIKKHSKYGKYLTNEEGYSIYVNTKDKKGDISCYDDCALKWPPVMLKQSQKIMMGKGVDGDILYGIRGTDGRFQITYGGYALYYYVKDTKPFDRKGQGLEGKYYLIPDKGKPLKPDENDMILSDSGDRETKSLVMTGKADVDVIPDLIAIDFNVAKSNNSIEKAMKRVNKSSRKVIRYLSKIVPVKQINLIDKVVYSKASSSGSGMDKKFRVKFYFKLTLEDSDTDKIAEVIDLLKKYRIKYSTTYTISKDKLSEIKDSLYSKALKDAMENAYNVLKPMNMKIDKRNPVKFINLVSGGVQDITPVYNPNRGIYFPAGKNVNGMKVDAKVSVNYNVI